MDSIFPKYDFAHVYDTLTNELDLLNKAIELFIDQFPGLVSEAGAKWGEYGWVPDLPQDNIYHFITAVNVPPTQEEADTLMLKELENTFDELLLSIKKHIKKA